MSPCLIAERRSAGVGVNALCVVCEGRVGCMGCVVSLICMGGVVTGGVARHGSFTPTAPPPPPPAVKVAPKREGVGVWPIVPTPPGGVVWRGWCGWRGGVWCGVVGVVGMGGCGVA